MKVEENWMRRLLNLATVRVDTAGVRASDPGEQDKDGRDVLLPILPSAAVDSLVAVVFPGIGESKPDWRRVSPCMIVRSTFKAAVVCVLLTGAAVWYFGSLAGLWTLLSIPLCFVYNKIAYRHLGYSMEPHFFRTRKGWFSRSTRILPIRNVQSIVLRQSVFDRRHGVWRLQIDSAGQAFTGGGPELRNVPFEAAESLAHSLAKRAAGTRYRV
jgi:putative membrane protein